MADKPIDEQRFTDQEVRAILKKAVTKAPARDVPNSDGLSLAELKEIAAEVGIDPSSLEDAARSLVRRDPGSVNPLVGAPTRIHLERRINGSLDAIDTHEAVSIIRRGMGRKGEVSEVGGALEWSVEDESGDRIVTVSSTDGVTKIDGLANLTNTAFLTYGPAGIMGTLLSLIGFLASAKDANEIGMVFFVTLIPLLYLLLRTAFKKVSSSAAAKLDTVVEELSRLIEAGQDEAAPDG